MDSSANEKSTMGQARPPPYPDNSNPGYMVPNQGYPAYQQGYGQPHAMGVGQQYPGQMSAVTVQPAVFVTRTPLANPPTDYLGYSIFTMLFCCLPLGIVALIYSIATRDAITAGDQATAERNSRMARIMNHVGLGIGLTIIIICSVYVGVMSSRIH